MTLCDQAGIKGDVSSKYLTFPVGIFQSRTSIGSVFHVYTYYLTMVSKWSCCRVSFPLVPVVLGHPTLKNEEVDQMKSGGQQRNVIE